MGDRAYRLVRVNVFTERRFGGNPLAVVLDADGLADGEMQAIAREMNIAETTFVLPPRDGGAARVRIFTPGRELPFAGHPTLGTAWVLATEGRVPATAAAFVLEEGIGPVPVRLEGDPRRPAFVWMGHADARFEPLDGDPARIAAALGLAGADLLPGYPLEIGSTGNAFVYIPLRDRTVIDRATLDLAGLGRALGGRDLVGVFVFAPDGEARVYSRMFAPHHGVAEDPATGSASGALGASLVRHGLVPAGRQVRIVSEQGTAMGRQSFVHIALAVRDGRVTDIEVGGAVVPALAGTLAI